MAFGHAGVTVLLKRGEIKAPPWGMHFGAYHQKLKHTWRSFGNADPLHQLLLKFVRPVLRGSKIK